MSQEKGHHVKFLALTQAEAEIVLDSFKCTNAMTRGIALKAAGLVLEFAAEDAVQTAQDAFPVSSSGPPEVS